ncbi:hypothetical protein [Nocardia sp. NPDC056100]|uniref:hypothetical protein n=1 Tax=Nocardia sp. NPDC056100 TaxID=3345712 RepID=UPI0035DCD574
MPRIRFTNPHSDKSFAVWVEPWARDYWLRPGDVITLEFDESDRAVQTSNDPDFDVARYDDSLVVWTGSINEVTVLDRLGTALECGHQRPT